MEQKDCLFFGECRRRDLLHLRRFDRRDVLGDVPSDEFLHGELVVHAAKNGELPGNRGTRETGVAERCFVELQMIGLYVKRPHAEPLHVSREVANVLAVDFETLLRLKNVAHPRHECMRRVGRVVRYDREHASEKRLDFLLVTYGWYVARIRTDRQLVR